MPKKIQNFFNNFNMINIYSEAFIYSIAALLFIFLLISQIGLSISGYREKLTFIEGLEGVSVENLEQVFKKGSITLKIMGIEPQKDILILINGEEAGFFDKEEITIPIRDNCVVEIDARKVKSPFNVMITSKSENVLINKDNLSFTVNSNITFITRAFLNF